jgi:hypothetical protein
MVANITGARLRDVERELALLRGEEAVTQYLEAHPHEARVLQYLVEQRRAGRSVPAPARIQRAMIWSDGTIELRTLPAPAPAQRAAPGAGRSARGQAPMPVRRVAGGDHASRAAPLARRRPGRRPDRSGQGEPDLRGVPRAGEGWALLRPGEQPPAPPEEPPPAGAAETGGAAQDAEAAGAGDLTA